MRLGSIVLAFGGGELGGLRDARADDSACQGVRVQRAADVPHVWDAPILVLLREIESPRTDAPCAAVTLSVDPTPNGNVRLAAMTSDGRYAEREVLRPSALAATALGLVAAIPDEAPSQQTSVETPQPASPSFDAGARPPRDQIGAPRSAVAAATVPAKPQRWALSLGAAAGARVAASTPLEMLDLEGRFDALFRARWLLTASFRYAPAIGPHPDDTIYDEFVGGIGAGGRIAFGAQALDVTAVSALAVMMMKWNADLPDAGGATTTAFRAGLSLRWSMPFGDSWRFSVTADADATPWAFHRDPPLGVDAPALPVWTAGLCVGASGAVL